MATIDDKIKQFKKEIGNRVLNEKQGTFAASLFLPTKGTSPQKRGWC